MTSSRLAPGVGRGLAAGRERGTTDAVAKPDRRRGGEARTHRCRIERSGLGAIQHRDGVTVVAGRCAGRSFRVGPVSIEHVRECFRLVRARNPADGPAADRSPVRDATDRRIRPRCGGAGAGVGSDDDDRATADLRPRRPRRRLAADPGAPRRRRLAGFLRATGEPRTSSRSRPARSTIRPGSGAPPSTTSGSTGSADRPPRMDISRRPGVGDAGGAAAPSTTRSRRPSRAPRATPTAARVAWEGEDGDGPPADERASSRPRSNGRPGCSRPRASGAGDRVGIFLPMLPETVIATLALGRLEAIFTPIFSGYGAPAVATRLRDCEASVLVTADGFLRRGRASPMKAGRRRGGRACRRRCSGSSSSAGSAIARRDAVEPRARPLVGRGDRGGRPVGRRRRAAPRRDRPRDALHADLHLGHDRPAEGRRPRPRRLPDQGRRRTSPTRSTCGRGDRLFWFTDLGWMMGPWAISGSLLLGARLVLYEGAPDFPGPDRLWSHRRPPRRHPPRPRRRPSSGR